MKKSQGFILALGQRRQNGAALIIIAFLLALVFAAYLIDVSNSLQLNAARKQKTSAALAEAKAALIGWSAAHTSMPGALPCPDTLNNGSSGLCTASAGLIGRLPWKSLGLPDVRDGDGECLWYAISPLYRNTISVSNRSTNPINSNVPGTITIKGADGADLAAPTNPVIAVIIAPGASLSGQDRSISGSSVCGGSASASNYLDSAQGVNNATGNVVASNYTFIAATASATFNDSLAYITAEDLYGPVRQRIAGELTGAGSPATSGLRKYYADNHVYPWAGDINGNVISNASSGYVPYNSSSPEFTLTPTSLRSWIINNGWLELATYQIGADFNPDSSGSYPQQCAGACLTVRGAQVPASITVGGGTASWTSRVCATNTLMTSCPLP
jgi:hypothetical protein